MSSDLPLLLIPGLGFGPEIFLEMNGIGLVQPPSFGHRRLIYLPTAPHSGMLETMAGLLNQEGLKCHVMGWSLGGLLALKLKEQLPHSIHKLVLVAVRDSFAAHEIEMQIQAAEKDLNSYLRHLYKRCFIGQQEAYSWFCQTLQPRFLQRTRLQDIIWGLNYLASHSARIEGIQPQELLLCHGLKDIIVPLHRIPKCPEGTEVAILNTGHLPFLHQDFSQIMQRFLSKD